jgi:phosphoglucosamine mutase
MTEHIMTEPSPIQDFGTDGVRGRLGTGIITVEGARLFGRAVGYQLGETDAPLYIGQDTRLSSEPLAEAMAEGAASVGRQVLRLGVLPTPALARLSEADDIAAVMLTASHNPARDNGYKPLQGGKISDETQRLISYYLNRPQEIPHSAGGKVHTDPALALRSAKRYKEMVVDTAPRGLFSGMRVVVDAANGAAVGFTADIIEWLGGNVTEVSNRPDGYNINLLCGVEHPGFLKREVQDGYDFGILHDGDADRIGVVGRDGTVYDGDDMLYMLASHRGERGVAGTSMTNEGLVQSLDREGIELVRAEVGDRYVNQALVDRGWNIGSEPSGHVLVKQHSPTGDGPQVAVELARVLRASGASLGEWASRWTRYPQTLINVEVDKALAMHPDVVALGQEISDQLGPDGRVLLRPSGTQSLVRVMVEARSAQDAARHAARLTARLGALAAA